MLLEEEDVVAYVWKYAATGQEVIACLTERLGRVPLVIPDS